jgi:hypothetical protein
MQTKNVVDAKPPANRGPAAANGAAGTIVNAHSIAPVPPIVKHLATWHLARILAGSADYDAEVIRAVHPDAPVNGEDPSARVEAVKAWLLARPELLEAVARMDPETPPETEGWQVYTLADAYAPRPPVEYILAGLLPLPSLSIVYAPPGCFKSMLMADLAACVAAGLPWLPPLPGKEPSVQRATMQAPVLWLDFDNGPRTMHERIEAVARARNLPEDTPLYYVSMPNPWLDMTDFTSVIMLAELMKQYKARLGIIDNLRDVAGGVDENKAEMGDVMSNFRRLTEMTGAAVEVIHHQRKGNGLTGRAGDTLRGHSSIEAALDLALLIEREEHADTVKIRATKARGADVLPFGAVFTYDHKPGTTELARVMFYGREVEDLTSDAAIRRAILETVEDIPDVTKGDLTNEVKATLPDVGVNRIRGQIDYLAAEGKLAMQAGKKTAKHYSIPTVRDPLDVAME